MDAKRKWDYKAHFSSDADDFQITDATIDGAERIWVSYNHEGRWLTANQVRELAARLNSVAATHEARTSALPAHIVA